RPSGFGRSGERVANTPCSRRRGSLRGNTCITSRRPWWSHVITISWSPALTRNSASAAHGSISSHASGAPSLPWRGAPFRSASVERMNPTGRSVNRFGAGRARARVFTPAPTSSARRLQLLQRLHREILWQPEPVDQARGVAVALLHALPELALVHAG